MNEEQLISYGKIIIIMLIVILIGMFSINESLKFYYNSQFLLTPCKLCEKLNNNTKCSNDNFLNINLINNNYTLPKLRP
jgi:hypothetical protein